MTHLTPSVTHKLPLCKGPPFGGDSLCRPQRGLVNETRKGRTMLRHANRIIGCDVISSDGSVGKVHDVLFDEVTWTFQHVVADIGSWLAGERVLLPLAAVGEIDEGQRQLQVHLTKAEVEHSPGVSTCATAPEEAEVLLGKYWMWTAPSVAHLPPEASRVMDSEASVEEKAEVEDKVESRLRSVRETIGYHIAAPDGDIGHLKDVIVDCATWQIQYLVVNTGNWLLQRNVLIPRTALESIHWADRKVHLSITRDEIKNSPEHDPKQMIDRDYEQSLHDHYRQEPYWREPNP